MQIKLTAHTNSLFNSRTYILENGESDFWVIDPGDTEFITDIIKGGKLLGILLTHVHFDHIYGLNGLIAMNPNCLVYTNEFGRNALVDSKLNMSKYHESPFVFNLSSNISIFTENSTIKIFDDLYAEAIFTPGHNPSCITWIIGNWIFTGDSYIPGVKTVTKLPYGDKLEAIESEKLILKLSEGKLIYPGHA